MLLLFPIPLIFGGTIYRMVKRLVVVKVFFVLGFTLAIVVFLVSGAVMVKAATALAGYADQIAKRTKLSGLFVGSLMLAFATSIPELVSEVTAARAGAPNLAVGDLLGSSMANMAILAIIDLLYRGKVWPSVELGPGLAQRSR